MNLISNFCSDVGRQMSGVAFLISNL
jgi:hypothetical protein